MNSNKNGTIEFLRLLFTFGVVIGHAWGNFVKVKNPVCVVLFHNTCVDFFFVLSGFLMAKHFYKNAINMTWGGV